MAKERLTAVLRRRLLGVFYLALVAGLISLSIAIYNKAFTSTVDVQLKTDYTGNSLLSDSDVKVRGLIVGSVKKVNSTGDGATVTLALEPSKVKDIPVNVSAQILPKTLFGEQYVALELPAKPGRTIKAGDVIGQDRSKSALEAQAVIGDLLPLLQAVRPAELNATLTAIATALNGRGQELGQTFVNLDNYLKALDPHATKLVSDLNKLGQTADLYNQAAPDIFATLQNLQTTSKTLVEQKVQLNDLLTTATSTSDIVTSFLNANSQRLIDLVGSSDKVYSLLDEYSPEFSCLFAGVAHLYDLTSDAVHDHQIQLSVVMDNTNQGKYKPGEQPRYITGYGPHCFGLPNPAVPFNIPPAYQCLNDGAALTANPCGADKNEADTRAINSPEEDALVDTLIAHSLGTTPNKVPGIATLLAAPLLRGNEVAVK